MEVFPPSGSQVPTNVVFQLTQNAGGLPTMQLFEGPAQTPVAVEVVVHHENWSSLQPRAPLTPGASYRLTDGQEFDATFTVSADADETPPARRELINAARTFIARSNTCGNVEFVQLTMESVASSEPTALVVLSGDTVTSRSLGGDPAAFTESGLLSNSGCEAGFPKLGEPDVAIAVRVIDAAGNLSEASRAKQVKTAGCSSAPGLLGVLGLLFLFRRTSNLRRDGGRVRLQPR